MSHEALADDPDDVGQPAGGPSPEVLARRQQHGLMSFFLYFLSLWIPESPT
jgi:hypothetical protein